MNETASVPEHNGDTELPYYPELVIRDMLLNGSFLVPIAVLEDVFAKFLNFQRLNKDSLIQTGLCGSLFEDSFELGIYHANLYCTRLPCAAFDISADVGRSKIEYRWFENQPVKLATIWVPSERRDTPRYVRVPDTDAWPSWMKAPKWPGVTLDHTRAAAVPFLRQGDVNRIEAERHLLFEIKELVLAEICRALKNQDASPLREHCIELIKNKGITREFLEFYGQVEIPYLLHCGRTYKAGIVEIDTTPGGVFSLFRLVGLVVFAIGEPEWKQEWEQAAELWLLVRERLARCGFNPAVTTLRSDYEKAIGKDVMETLASLEFDEWILSNHEFQTLLSADLDLEVPVPPVHASRSSVPEVSRTINQFVGTLRDYAADPAGRHLQATVSLRQGEYEHENLFRRSGQVWNIMYQGKRITLHHLRGLSYIAILLKNPNMEIYAVEMAQMVGKAADRLWMGKLKEDREDDGDDGIYGDYIDRGMENMIEQSGIEIADAAAIREMNAQLKKAQITLLIAEETQDVQGQEQNKKLIRDLSQGLRSALGKGGRHRKTGSTSEQARSAVGMAIGRALKSIRSAHINLYRYLDRTLNRGTRCGYYPQKEEFWDVEM